MLTHVQRAERLQDQYDGIIKSRTVAEVNYLPIETADSYDILFEGTSNLEDAKRDLQAIMISCPFGRVHQGAYAGLLDVYAREASNIPKDKPVRLDGHSLGAMEAALFACILYQAGYRNVEALTFESPLWGDARAVAYYNQMKNLTYQNYLNLFEHDLFTTIPVHLAVEPYVPPTNRIRFWSPPTPANEWAGAGVLIESHSLKDCVIPGLVKLCG